MWWRLNDALAELATIDARPSQVVELRFFGGFSVEETAETLGVSVRTVINDWNTARAWLHHELADEVGMNAAMNTERWRILSDWHNTWLAAPAEERDPAASLFARASGTASDGRRTRRLQWRGRRLSRDPCPGARRSGSGAGRATAP